MSEKEEKEKRIISFLNRDMIRKSFDRDEVRDDLDKQEEVEAGGQDDDD